MGVLLETATGVADEYVEWPSGFSRGFIMLADGDGPLQMTLARGVGRITLTAGGLEISRKVPQRCPSAAWSGAPAQRDPKRVLLLYDEDTRLRGLSIFDRSLRSHFRAALGSNIEFFTESMNVSQFNSVRDEQVLREPDFFDRYKSYVIGGGALLVAQTAMIAGLLFQRRRRRRAERELRNSYERISNLGGRVLNAQDVERARVARELHDDTDQQIVLLQIDLQAWRDFDAVEQLGLGDDRHAHVDDWHRLQSHSRGATAHPVVGDGCVGSIGRTLASKPGSEKNGQDSRARPLGFRTRCGVDRYGRPRGGARPELPRQKPWALSASRHAKQQNTSRR